MSSSIMGRLNTQSLSSMKNKRSLGPKGKPQRLDNEADVINNEHRVMLHLGVHSPSDQSTNMPSQLWGAGTGMRNVLQESDLVLGIPLLFSSCFVLSRKPHARVRYIKRSSRAQCLTKHKRFHQETTVSTIVRENSPFDGSRGETITESALLLTSSRGV